MAKIKIHQIEDGTPMTDAQWDEMVTRLSTSKTLEGIDFLRDILDNSKRINRRLKPNRERIQELHKLGNKRLYELIDDGLVPF